MRRQLSPLDFAAQTLADGDVWWCPSRDRGDHTARVRSGGAALTRCRGNGTEALIVGDFHAVAAVALGPVECRVGAAQQQMWIVERTRNLRRHAHAYRHRHRRIA